MIQADIVDDTNSHHDYSRHYFLARRSIPLHAATMRVNSIEIAA